LKLESLYNYPNSGFVIRAFIHLNIPKMQIYNSTIAY